MPFDVQAARAFLDALGAGDAVHNFRALHDVDHGRPGIPMVGTLDQRAAELEAWNSAGYGIFVAINELIGGLSIENVRSIRAQFIDKDGDPDWTTYKAALAWECPPTFCVVTSVGKFHAYWVVDPYSGVDRFSETQRKLITKFNSDDKVNDGPRVMRLPGSLNMKVPTAPAVVTMFAGSGKRYGISALEWALSSVVATGGSGERHALGDTEGAPSMEWAVEALRRIDPKTLSYGDWVKVSAAFRQGAFKLGDVAAHNLWLAWCEGYGEGNRPGENEKLWRSFDRGTSATWSFLARQSNVGAEIILGRAERPSVPMTVENANGHAVPAVDPSALLTPPGSMIESAYLLASEQAEFFKGCNWVSSLGRVRTPFGRLMDANKFNGTYGGKLFQFTSDGKTTDEPWKAATRGQVYQIPKVDSLRFLPSSMPGDVVTDELGRTAVNTYIPARIDMREGDASRWVEHVRKIMPTEWDFRILMSYMAHIVQRPGVKAFWCPVIQSMEGAGKGIIGEALTHAVGLVYTHEPDAQKLVDSGGKFNSWMAEKLLIIANEIKTDDKRNLLEMLKKMITDARMEVEGKGADQIMADNATNWVMFTNWQDAIPISRDTRRYAIFFSKIQHFDDLARFGIDGNYFPSLFKWLRHEGGKECVAWFLKNYPIEAEFDPAGLAHRAPVTSSTAEAIVASRGRAEQVIADAVESGLPGFRNGWVSSAATAKLFRAEGLHMSKHALRKSIENLGFSFVGRAGRGYLQEDGIQPQLFNSNGNAIVSAYAFDQGYGNL